MVRIEAHGLPGFLFGDLEFPECHADRTGEKRVGLHVARIRLRPDLADLPGLLEVSRDCAVIDQIDEELLVIARAIP